MKLRIYLDTSVISAYYDTRETDRQAMTEELWDRLEVNTSLGLPTIEIIAPPEI